MPLKPKALGIAGGVMCSVCCFLMALIAMLGYGKAIVTTIGSVYLGYDASVIGAILGLVYGFIDGFIGLYVFALLYNKLEKKL